jgi:hypothetical protein
MKNFQRFRIFGLAALVSLVLVACAQTAPVNTNSGNVNSAANINSSTNTSTATTYMYPGQDGKNALELLKVKFPDTTTKTSSQGEYVTGINGVAAGAKQYWKFLVNEKEAPVGPGTYVTKSADVITWELSSF